MNRMKLFIPIYTSAIVAIIRIMYGFRNIDYELKLLNVNLILEHNLNVLIPISQYIDYFLGKN